MELVAATSVSPCPPFVSRKGTIMSDVQQLRDELVLIRIFGALPQMRVAH